MYPFNADRPPEDVSPTERIELNSIRAASLLLNGARLLGRGRLVGEHLDDAQSFDLPMLEFSEVVAQPLDELTLLERGRRFVDIGAEFLLTIDAESTAASLWELSVGQQDPDAFVALLWTVARQGTNARVSVAALTVLSELAGRAGPQTRLLLRQFVRSLDPVAAEMASVALQQNFYPDPEQLLGPAGRLPSRPSASICVHGTWARLKRPSWFEPSSSMHNHIAAECTPDLYMGVDYFRWGGRYSDLDRTLAVKDLKAWQSRNRIGSFDTIFAHSHGSNVVLDFVSQGHAVPLLVLMHSPFMPRTEDQWEAIYNNVGRVLVLRNYLDLVVMVDGLVDRSTTKLPAWFDKVANPAPFPLNPEFAFRHSTFTNLKTWKKLGISNQVVYERSLA